MGSAFTPGASPDGVIPRAMSDIFARIAECTDAEFAVRVSFVEIYQVRLSSYGLCTSVLVCSTADRETLCRTISETCW